MIKSRYLNDYPDILTPEDLMYILDIGRSTVYKLLSCGSIPSIRIGKLYRIPKNMLVSTLNPHTDGLPKKGVPC